MQCRLMNYKFYRNWILKPDLNIINAKYKGLVSTNNEIKNTIDKFHHLKNLNTGILLHMKNYLKKK
jgi:hypothetical protein